MAGNLDQADVSIRANDVTLQYPLFQVLSLLIREGDAERIDLRSLNDDDVRAYIGQRYSAAP